MGGHSSGRHGWRGVVEQRKRLDVRIFRRRGWLRRGGAGVLRWTSNGEPDGSISYCLGDDELRLDYTVGEGDDRARVTQRISLERTRCRYGGHRHYWRCPRCARRVEVVIMATHGRWWGCRRCIRLRYVSQGLAPADRLQHRANRLYARAGTDDGEGVVVKRKWMRWPTYNRLVELANRYDSAADSAFALRCMRRFGLLPDVCRQDTRRPASG